MVARTGGTQDEGDTVSEQSSDSTDPAAIEAEIDATRARLAATVDELAVRIHPKTLAQRGKDDAIAKVRAATTTPEGQPRIERLAAIGAAAVALLALVVWRRRRG